MSDVSVSYSRSACKIVLKSTFYLLLMSLKLFLLKKKKNEKRVNWNVFIHFRELLQVVFVKIVQS